jgi:hypothetical protein
MGNDVDEVNVAGQNGDALFAVAEDLDDFYDAAAYVFDGCGLLHKRVRFLGGFLGRQRVADDIYGRAALFVRRNGGVPVLFGSVIVILHGERLAAKITGEIGTRQLSPYDGETMDSRSDHKSRHTKHSVRRIQDKRSSVPKPVGPFNGHLVQIEFVKVRPSRIPFVTFQHCKFILLL